MDEVHHRGGGQEEEEDGRVGLVEAVAGVGHRSHDVDQPSAWHSPPMMPVAGNHCV